ncbi:tetratricopeptide repeat-containing sulfotransferase family protein [Leisingera sp. ANG-Vp]|uniref:tetratricopeptide repeat-containing sulfotransferase family protein n=1 Tax=Leisingera sp. ANG-Vp TaxID=1577896 RepID=UPI00057FDC43|nr:sulfotransferase [Leisingera sp. ANG-Vp]KIC14295.1 hypothetical protein RA20_21035 [Leisingera sp. ANG-Vp]
MNQHLRTIPDDIVPENTAPKESWLVEVDRLKDEGDFKGALAVLNPRLRGGDLEIRTIDRAALCYFYLGNEHTAISLMKVMCDRWPDTAAVWGKLASMQMAAGDKESAIENFKKALELDPYLIRALTALNNLEPFSPMSGHTARLKKLAKWKDLPPKDASIVFNALGNIERRQKKPAAAMRHFLKSKELLGAKFNPVDSTQLVDIQTAVFKANDPLEMPSDGPKMVFVCGLPRSGTTLTETILKRHSSVGSVGESKALGSTYREVRKYCEDVGRGSNPWSWFGSLTDQEILVFRKFYYTAALRGDDKGPVVVDKMPLNCFNIGLAHVLLPEAKIVFMSRHPLDVGLSNISISFRELTPFTCKLEWMGHMTSEVYRSALDYQSKVQDQMRVQSYEALVREPETQIRGLLAHCGLDWEDACLNPEEGAGIVNTASVNQVREKINTKGLEKWKPFEKQLQPMAEALGGQEWISKWQEWDRNAALTGKFEPGSS